MNKIISRETENNNKKKTSSQWKIMRNNRDDEKTKEKRWIAMTLPIELEWLMNEMFWWNIIKFQKKKIHLSEALLSYPIHRVLHTLISNTELMCKFNKSKANDRTSVYIYTLSYATKAMTIFNMLKFKVYTVRNARQPKRKNERNMNENIKWTKWEMIMQIDDQKII